MREISANKLRELATDIELELDQLRQLEKGIQQVKKEIQEDSERVELFYESLALKLHNFYTGCERIFLLIASELNGSTPSEYDWRKRLLHRMSVPHERHPPLLTKETVARLEEYLAFRHVVRNIYGFELDPKRLDLLMARYSTVWLEVSEQATMFIEWLRTLAEQLEQQQ